MWVNIQGDAAQDLTISFKVTEEVEDSIEYLEQVDIAVCNILESYKKCNFKDYEAMDSASDLPEKLVPGVVYQVTYKVFSYIEGSAKFVGYDYDDLFYVEDAKELDIEKGSFYDESVKELETLVPGFVLVDSKFSDFDYEYSEIEIEFEEPEPPDWYYDRSDY